MTLALPFPALSDCGNDFFPTPPKFQDADIEGRSGLIHRTEEELLAVTASNQNRAFGPSLVED